MKTIENQTLIPSDNDKSTNFQAFINLFKCSIGIGILSIPYYTYKAGYVLSIILMTFVFPFTFYATIKVIHLADLKGLTNKEINFEKLYRDIVGKYSFVYFQICLGVIYFGTCASYVIFFVEYFENVFNTSQVSCTLLYSIAALTIIIPLSVIRNFHFFMKYSFLANFLTIFTLISMIIYCFLHFDSNNSQDIADFGEIPGILGVFLFSFRCIGQALAIRNSMQKPEDFSKICFSVFASVLLLFIILSISCVFGLSSSQITPNILQGFGKMNTFFLVLEGLYALNLIISYPIQMTPLIEIIEGIPVVNKFIVENEKTWILKNSARILTAILIFPFAIFIDNLADFVSFLGSFSGLMIQFVFPLWAYNKFLGERLEFKTKIAHLCIIFVAIGATIYTCYLDLLTLISDF